MTKKNDRGRFLIFILKMSRICRKGLFFAILATDSRIFLHMIYKTILTYITDYPDNLKENDCARIVNVIF